MRHEPDQGTESTATASEPPSEPKTGYRDIRLRIPTFAALARRASLSSPVLILLFLAALSGPILSYSFYRSGQSQQSYAAAERLRLEVRLDSLRIAVMVNEMLSERGSVDLRKQELQPIDNKFHVGHLKVAGEPGGALVSGLIINTTALDHSAAEFLIVADGIRREFTVMSLPAGGSGRFQVSVPGVIADSLRVGRLVYQQATVSFRRPR